MEQIFSFEGINGTSFERPFSPDELHEVTKLSEYMKEPLVSVICLCYNQACFVKEALDSVKNQSYTNIELIVVDDASSDDSKGIITEWLQLNGKEHIPFVDIDVNVGNTTAFNKGYALSKGKYVIDLSGDDVLALNRVEKQVKFFEQQEEKIGVIYSDALYINEIGEDLKFHFDSSQHVPYVGDIYRKIIDTYFIPTPTMMIRKDVLDELGGYDENLAYEDFDFWVRSSRKWHYAYQSDVLTKIRVSNTSQSSSFYQKNDNKVDSTFKVCQKILRLNRNQEEGLALVNRIKYEIRQTFLTGRKKEMMKFFGLWSELGRVSYKYIILKCIGKLGINLIWLKKPVRSVLRKN